MKKDQLVEIMFTSVLTGIIGLILVLMIGGWLITTISGEPCGSNILVTLCIIGFTIGYAFGVLLNWEDVKNIDE
jgi:hypothetical protein